MNDTPNELDGSSLDISRDNRIKLKAILPSVFIETVNDKGELVEAVDLEKLKAELGTFTELFESRRERYGMDWPGKKDALKLIQAPSFATLKPCREESVNFDTTENLFIEGDNLEVLKLLQKSYYGKVKMIYIDPPYNTGKEFIYPDNYSESLETYLEYAGLIDGEGKKFSTNTANEGRFHTKWLNMMYPRLYLALNLLRNDGVMFISIDEHEIDNLIKVCNEIFGEENQIGVIANVNNPKGRSDDRFIATAHEYLLIYAKNKNNAFWKGFEPEEKVVVRYNKNDVSGQYREIDLRKTGDNDRREDRPNLFYYFYYNQKTGQLYPSKEEATPDGFIQIFPTREDGVEGNWRWELKTAVEKIGMLIPKYMTVRKKWGVFEKDYFDENDLLKPISAWTFKDVNSERGSELLVELGFSKEIFPRPKPMGLLKRALQLSADKEDIILDFFAGSATTAHAVLDLNKHEGSSHRFILIQLPELCGEDSEAFKAGYKTIADIGKDRIRRVIKSLNEEDEGKFDFNGKDSRDCGFKVFKLDKSNFKQWQKLTPDSKPEQIEKQLELHIDHIDKGVKPEDMLYEILIKAGFAPTEKVQIAKLVGIDVFSIADGALLICLAKAVTKELINAVAEAEPIQFICLDSAFGDNDQLKANAVQTFAARNMGRDKVNQIVFRTV